MSMIQDLMALALSTISTARGESLGYRTGTTGGFTALTGFVLDWSDGPNPEYEERIGAERTPQQGTLSGPTTPALAIGYQVQDASLNVWAIKGGNVDGQQQIWTVEAVTVANYGPDRRRTQ